MADILLLGDDRARDSELASLLCQDRHCVRIVRDVDRWREAEAEVAPDLIVVALRRADALFHVLGPKADGFLAPILILKSSKDAPMPPHRDERVVDGLCDPFTPEELLARIDALIRVRHVIHPRTEPAGVRAGLLQRFGTRLSVLLGTRVTGFARPEPPYQQVAARIAVWADRRDGFLPGHAQRVAAFATLIAQEIGLTEAETTSTAQAATLHDIGKAVLPCGILRRRGPLAEDEKLLIETHSERGAAILQVLKTDTTIVEAIRFHHERFDGNGPCRRGGLDLPKAARILAVAETYDAMTSTLLKPAVTSEQAAERIRRLKGGQLDPRCVDALLTALRSRRASIAADFRVSGAFRAR